MSMLKRVWRILSTKGVMDLGENLEIRELAKKFLPMEIGNGSTVSFFFGLIIGHNWEE